MKRIIIGSLSILLCVLMIGCSSTSNESDNKRVENQLTEKNPKQDHEKEQTVRTLRKKQEKTPVKGENGESFSLKEGEYEVGSDIKSGEYIMTIDHRTDDLRLISRKGSVMMDTKEGGEGQVLKKPQKWQMHFEDGQTIEVLNGELKFAPRK